MDKITLVLIGVLFCLTAASFLWLGFLLWKPAQWGAFVDWEYAFWVRHGLISTSFAEKCKRAEKGFVLKCLLGGAGLLGTGFLLAIGWLLLRS
jgi:hypothetical protein